MEKTIKFGMIFFPLFALLIIINLLLNSSREDNIKNYLMNMGYIVESDDNMRLVKMIDSETIDYFNLSDYTLTRMIDNQNNAFQYSLTMTYDYRSHELIYNYHTTHGENINVILKGNYLDSIYTCDKVFSTAPLTNADINNICDLVKIKVEYFNQSAQVLFNNHRLVEYMESVKNE